MKEKISKFNNKVICFSVKLVVILFALIIVFLAISSIAFTAKFRNSSWNDYNEGINILKDNVLINILLLLLLTAILYFMEKVLRKVSQKLLVILSLITTGVIGIFWVNYIKAPLRADSKVVYTVAIEFLNGKYNSLSLPNYMGIHPMQIGIVYFIELFYKVFQNTNPLIFQNFNVILVIICNFLIYKISKNLFEDTRIQRITLILLTMFVAMPLCSVLVYGNIIGLVFALLSILFLIKYLSNRKIRYLIMLPISMLLSIIVKANYEIVLIAIIIVLLLDILKKFNIKNLIIILLSITLVKNSNPLLYALAETQSNNKVSEGTPMISYIAMGMYKPTDRAPGWYNTEFNVEFVYIKNEFDVDKTKEESIKVIKGRLNEFKNNPKEFAKYYFKKIESTWIEPTFQTIWTSSPMEVTDKKIENYYASQKLIPSLLSGKASKILIKYLDILEIMIYLSNVYYIYIGIKNKTFKYDNIILIIAFLGGFFFHILWETKSIYVLPFYFILIPSGAAGLSNLFHSIENKINKEKINTNKIEDLKKE